MKHILIRQALALAILNLTTVTAFAWDHSIEIGYGTSHDPNHTRYNNSGALLSSDVYTIKRTPNTRWSINGAVGRWHTNSPVHKDLSTAAVSLAVRYYPYTIADQYPAYLLGSVGPAYLSTRKFGYNTQAAHVTFQWNAGLGVELKNIDVNFRLAHFSNAYLAKPDEGFTVIYMLSLGYLF
jgi:hypothetical protein